MIHVSKYKVKNGRVMVSESVYCPDCGTELVYRDSVRRKVKDADGRN